MRVIAAVPTYDGQRVNAQALVQLNACGVEVVEMRLSLLTRAFNECWVHALNLRSEGATHFLMLHADVVPVEGTWPVQMLHLMQKHGSDVLSAVLPIKSGGGFTSTAVETEDVWSPRKLTLKEVMERPGTWTEERLLVNTGLMLVDIAKPWADHVYFSTSDRIRRSGDGQWVAECQPEDWSFSRRVREEGGSVWATREVRALHAGWSSWANWEK
jgi:hypothetical protein